MAESFLKITGRVFVALSIMLCGINLVAAQVSASLDRRVISAGESTVLTISVTGDSDVDVSDIPEVGGLRITYAGKGSSYQFYNGRSSSSTTISFRLYAEREGTYTIPSFEVTAGDEKFFTQPLTLTVRSGASSGDEHMKGFIFCDVELSSDSVYAGQPVIMRYYVYHDANSDFSINRIGEAPVSKGFIIKSIDEKREPELVMKNGMSMVKELAVSYCLIPEISGDYETGGGTMVALFEQTRGFFSMPVQSEIRFPQKRIRIKALPVKGKPSGYAGDVGSFKIDAAFPHGTYRVNEEVRIDVTLSGSGNFLIMSKPVFENTAGYRMLIAEGEPELMLSGSEITGTKRITLTLIPQREGAIKPGRLKFSYFNPSSGTYETASTDELTLDITGIIEPREVNDNKSGTESDRLPVAAYVFAGILLAAAIGGAAFVFLRDRKRYSGIDSHNTAQDEIVLAEPLPDPAAVMRRELEAAHESGDSARLMELCVKSLDLVKARISDADSIAEFEKIKDKLYSWRYAGALLSSHELEEVYKVIAGFLR